MDTQTALAGKFEAIVLGRITSDKLQLPAMPQAALKCLQQMREPEFSIKQVASNLEKDPVLAAQVLRLANSAAFGAGGVKTIDLAATRIGAQKLKTLLVEASTRRVFESKDPRIVAATKGVWEHSLAVALLARDLSALLGGSADAESAYLAGLLHDVGKPVVGGILLEAEKMIASGGRSAAWIGSTEWIGVVQSTHRKIGVALAEKWNIPEAICQSIRDCNEYDSADRHSIGNYVRFANALAKQEGIYVGEVDPEDISALVMIGRSLLGAEEDVLKRLITGLKERVRAHLE